MVDNKVAPVVKHSIISTMGGPWRVQKKDIVGFVSSLNSIDRLNRGIGEMKVRASQDRAVRVLGEKAAE
jgi:hypothetical protein